MDVCSFTSTGILLAEISPVNTEANIEWDGNLNSRLTASRFRNIYAKNC